MTKKEPVVDLTQERDERCKPLVVEIIKFLASKGDEIQKGFGSHGVTEDGLNEYYSGLVGEFFENFRGKGLKMQDTNYIMKMAVQLVDLFGQKVKMTLDFKHDKAVSYLWGVQDASMDLEIDKVEKIEEEIAKEKVDN